MKESGQNNDKNRKKTEMDIVDLDSQIDEFSEQNTSNSNSRKDDKNLSVSKSLNEPISDQLKDLLGKLEKKDTEYDKLYDRYLRLMADYDNLKRRSAEERIKLIDSANKKLLTKLLDAVDSFDKLKNSTDDGIIDNESLNQTIISIHSQFWKILSDTGLQKIETIGNKFNPNFHEAIYVKEDDSFEEDTILEEVQSGYILNKETLRASKVVLSKLKKGDK